MTAPIQDLRDAIALLQQHDNQYQGKDILLMGNNYKVEYVYYFHIYIEM